MPVDQLANRYGVSTRTIRTDISAINTVLNPHGAKIEMERNVGYHLTVSDKNEYQKLINDISTTTAEIPLGSAPQRIDYLLIRLLFSDSFISKQTLAHELSVEESTLDNYIRTVRHILQAYDLDYINQRGRGIKISGSELNKRECFSNEAITRDHQTYIKGFTQKEIALFNDIDLELITDIVTKQMKRHAIEATDYGFKNLLLHVAIVVHRALHDQHVVVSTVLPYSQTTSQFVVDICTDIEQKMNISLPVSEQQYLSAHTAANTSSEQTAINQPLVTACIQDALEIIYNEYGFDLRNDNALHSNLMNHIVSILQSKRHNETNHSRNLLVNTIRRTYPLAFEITLSSVMRAFHPQGIEFSEEDISFIALHIGIAIERSSLAIHQPKRTLIVCSFGNAAAKLLESRIETYFDKQLEIVGSCSYQEYLTISMKHVQTYELVISTVQLDSKEIPVVIVDFRLQNQDLKLLSKFLEELSSQDSKDARRFFSRDTFHIYEKPVDKQTILHDMCRTLSDSVYDSQRLYESVMEREDMADTAMDELFAIPHPLRSQATKSQVAVALIRNPVAWSTLGTAVRIVFLLAIKQGDRIGLEKLYDLSLCITNNEEMRTRLTQVTTYEQFISCLSISNDE